MSEATPKESEVYLHFVGTGLYGSKRFEAEARKIGIQRAVLFTTLTGMEWGDPVYLAEYVTEMVNTGVEGNPLAPNEKKKVERAVCFGMTYVEGISYNIPDEVKAKVIPKLHIVAEIAPAGNQTRMCGSYMDGGGFQVIDTLEQIVGYIEDACKELDLDPRSFKYFVKGSFYKLDPMRIIHNQKFFRGFKKISLSDVPSAPGSPKETGGSMVYIYDYDKRKYIKKEDRDRLDNTLALEFSATTSA